MAMMMSEHIQMALDDLKAAGAKEVVVVPVTVHRAPTSCTASGSTSSGSMTRPNIASVPRVKTDAVLKIVPPPGDDPLVAEILLDYAMEMSTDPKNEVVIIAGHGPTSDGDNARK